jgi:hypothetical protein
MNTFAAVAVIGFTSMLLFGATAFVIGRRLKSYLRDRDPQLFSLLYGDGSLIGKSIRNDLARLRFVHSKASDPPRDRALGELRRHVRVAETLYIVAFAITVVSFLCFVALQPS